MECCLQIIAFNEDTKIQSDEPVNDALIPNTYTPLPRKVYSLFFSCPLFYFSFLSTTFIVLLIPLNSVVRFFIYKVRPKSV